MISSILVENLDFSYPKLDIYSNFNLMIDSSITGIIGVNGAGKTTLLKLIAGLLKPSAGVIEICGVDLAINKQESLKYIGVLHENPMFPTHAKVFAYLEWVGKIRGLDNKNAREQTWLLIKKFNLEKKVDSYVFELSAGLKQRFGIAQAIIGIPKIILLDEPTANLDAKSRVEILDFLKQLTNEYDTKIIIMSHILSDLERFCDEVVIIHNGQIKFKSSIYDLLHNNYPEKWRIRSTSVKNEEIIKYLMENKFELLSNRGDEIEFQIGDKSIIKSIQEEFEVLAVPSTSILEQTFLKVIKD
jgi:ABC-2 type transport system ATP-binding protein